MAKASSSSEDFTMFRLLENAFIIYQNAFYQTSPPPWHDLIISPPI